MKYQVYLQELSKCYHEREVFGLESSECRDSGENNSIVCFDGGGEEYETLL